MKNIFYLVFVVLIAFGAYQFGAIQKEDNNTIERTAEYVPDKEPKVVTEMPSLKRATDPITRISSSEEATIDLFEEAAPSVVFITTSNFQKDYWSRNVYEIPSGSGSGFVWDNEGHIVTNYHVIKNAKNYKITLSDQTEYEAELVGSEPRKDVAVLKIKAPRNKLTPIKVGSSNNLKVGQSVYAIGNPFGLDQTLTTGVISALGREISSQAAINQDENIPIRDVIQTDAAINPGNSGGPLLDSSGRLIGVNTAIYSPSGAYAGIGFSVPVDIVNWAVSDIVKYGEVRRPYIGISMLPVQQMRQLDLKGAYIAGVSRNGAAFKAGLKGFERDQFGRAQIGDLIVAINEYKVEDYNDLVLTLEKFKVGDEITVTYIRNKEKEKVKLILGSEDM
jgi:S1-C subfamily serine protease